MLWIGVFITAFLLYVTFVASTLTPQDIAQVPMQLFPSPRWDRLSRGRARARLAPTCRLLPDVAVLNLLIVALVVTFGKITVSPLSAHAVVFSVPGPNGLLDDFHHADAAVEVRIPPTYQGGAN